MKFQELSEKTKTALDSSLVREEATGCLVWTRHTRKTNGYGEITIDGRGELVHRLTWVRYHGPIPDDKPYVLHSCDNPACSEISHLFVGTQADNLRDMASKGRGRKSRSGLPAGVYPVPSTGKYQVRVYLPGKRRGVNLGSYESLEKATSISVAAKRLVYGS